SVAHVTRGLQQGGEGQHTGFYGLFAPRLRTRGLCQGVLERGLQPRMTVLAQTHKECSRLACTRSHFLFFPGQCNRWIPHRGRLQMGGVCSSATYKSTEPPVVSILFELLSKQLISILGAYEVLLQLPCYCAYVRKNHNFRTIIPALISWG